MDSRKHISCGPCMFDDVTKDAGRWCTNCEEGLCEDCENLHRKSKTSRNHKVITIEDYRKIEHVSISQVCEHHGENLEWFCKSHDDVLCVVCVPSKHKECSDVIPISIYSANSRQSAALSDLEDTLHGTLRNVEKCITNRKSATKEFEKQELDVKTMILETRTKINAHLDKLQEKLLHELRSTSDNYKSKYMKILRKLESTEELIIKLSEQTKQMKQFSSDMQVFLGTRLATKRIIHEVDSIKTEISLAKDYELKVSIDSLIENLSNDVEEFGKIIVSDSANNLDFRDQKIDQAQIEITIPTSRNISDIQLQLIKTFEMEKTNGMTNTGCVILPNGHVLIANNYKEQNLIEYSDTGEHIRDIQVSGNPYDIAVIDVDRIAVTYGRALYLEIMNNNTFNVRKKISLQNSCYGVSHMDGILYVVNEHSTIQVMDLLGKQLKTLKTSSVGVPSMTTNRDRIFYADYKRKQVHCCRLNGEELWKFGCGSIDFPYDLTVDYYHNVYVVDFVSNSLIIIQHDGKDCKTLLTKLDGLKHPIRVNFDQNKRTLIVCNQEGKVALFKVV